LTRNFARSITPYISLSDNAYLRPILVEDVSISYIDGLNDPEVHRFLVAPRQAKQSLESVKEYVWMNWEASDALLFGLFIDETLIGTVRLHDISDEEAYIGIAIFDRSMWGQGWGAVIVSAMVSYSVNELDVRRLLAGIEYNNIASQKIFKKAGFHLTAEHKSDKKTCLWVFE